MSDGHVVDWGAIDRLLGEFDGRVEGLAEAGRDFARVIHRLQRIVRMVLVHEEKTFGYTLQRWRLVDGDGELELGTERRGAGRFAVIARWAGGRQANMPLPPS
jgi:hypothetical protein